ncbi:MAG: STAS domain-containing protein [Epsilonproteobacteria bacterium]|nr:STAS domain-containing protein [Campylobacterota bacterium]
MAITFTQSELTIDNIEQNYDTIKAHLDENPIELDLGNIEVLDLANIQMFLSLRKYCHTLNKEFKIQNVDSNQIKEELKLFKLI